MIIEAGLQSCHWGYFDASLDPVATVASGSEVTMNSVSGGKAMLPGEGFSCPA